MQEITDRLFEMQDLKYRDFNSSLNPTLNKNCFIGVRTPLLRSFAKEIKGTELAEKFILELPHKYFEENQLHALLFDNEKSFDKCIKNIELFLPYVNNWATCDQLNPKILKKHPEKFFENIKIWIKSNHTYTVRYAIKKLMDIYLDDNFQKKYCDMVAEIKSDEYYICMMQAWYFATALAKQYDTAIEYLENHKLTDFVHKKTIQKACESFRVSNEHKIYLKSLR